MQLSKLFNDDKAVSPVIGVILMVAITVILAAVIGTFVLGLGDSIGDTSPSASINGETSSGEIVFTHQSGENINGDNLRLSDSDDLIEDFSTERGGVDGFDDGETFSAGDAIEISNDDISQGDAATVRLVWASDGSSSTLSSADYDEDTGT